MAATIGGGVGAVGNNDLVQGYVQSKTDIGLGGGFTLGPASLMSGKPSASILAHELGHTVQFIALSALGSGKGGVLSYQWLPYLALGGMGILGEWEKLKPATGLLPDIGRWWEGLATALGTP
jgi:hypothetical protein